MTEESHVLVIFPHPDDESFSSAGTLARYIDNGIPVTYACLTLGQMGRNLGIHLLQHENHYHILGKKLENAMAAIGITDLRKMGLRDKTVEFEPHDEMDAMVKSLIDELQPSVIISFYPKFAVHPDHEATAEAVVRTVGRMAKEDRPRLQLVAFSNDAKEKLGEPDILNEISDYKEVKLRAFEAHASQTGPFLEQLATPDVSGQVKSFLEVEPYWTYNFES